MVHIQKQQHGINLYSKNMVVSFKNTHSHTKENKNAFVSIQEIRNHSITVVNSPKNIACPKSH